MLTHIQQTTSNAKLTEQDFPACSLSWQCKKLLKFCSWGIRPRQIFINSMGLQIGWGNSQKNPCSFSFYQLKPSLGYKPLSSHSEMTNLLKHHIGFHEVPLYLFKPLVCQGQYCLLWQTVDLQGHRQRSCKHHWAFFNGRSRDQTWGKADEDTEAPLNICHITEG